MSEVNFQITAIGASSLPSPVRGRDSGPATNSTRDRSDDAHRITAAATTARSLTLETVAAVIDRYVPKELPNTQLKIDHDEGTGLFVYKAVDRDSGEVVRQYPADEILRFIAFYREREGVLVDDSA